MAMLSKAKAQVPEEQETPEDEAAEAPEEQQAEEDAGTEQPMEEGADVDTPATDPAEESAEGGLSDQQLGEYQKAVDMLHNVLYKNEATGRAVLAQINEQDKVGSLARAGVLIIQQLDKRLNFSDPIIPLVIITVVDRLLELADRVKKLAYSEQESAQVVQAVTAGTKALYGQSPPQGTAPQGPPEEIPPQSQGGPVPAGPGLPPAPQAGPAPQPGG